MPVVKIVSPDLAPLNLAKELYELSGRRTGRILTSHGSNFSSAASPSEGSAPAYTTSYLMAWAYELGHRSLKFRQTDTKSVVLTAPPCYHMHAKDPVTALALMLIRTIKRNQKASNGK